MLVTPLPSVPNRRPAECPGCVSACFLRATLPAPAGHSWINQMVNHSWVQSGRALPASRCADSDGVDDDDDDGRPDDGWTLAGCLSVPCLCSFSRRRRLG